MKSMDSIILKSTLLELKFPIIIRFNINEGRIQNIATESR